MKKLKQLTMMSLLFGALFLFGANSVNAQNYVSAEDAVGLLTQEINVLSSQTGKAVPGTPSAFASVTTQGLTLSDYTKKGFFELLVVELKSTNGPVGQAIEDIEAALISSASGLQSRLDYVASAEQAAQDLLQL